MKSTLSVDQPAQPADEPARPQAAANKHTARRLETSATLLEAARRLIGEGRWSNCSVDDICQVAGISRAAFYLHFSNKAALLSALQEENCGWYVRQFRKLDAATAATEAGLVAWFRHFVRGFEAAKHSILLFTAHEFGLSSVGARRRGEAVLILGGQVPTFRLVREDGGIDEERRIGLLLLVFQVEQLSLHLVLNAPSDGELALRVLARQFLNFMAPAKVD